MKITVNIRRNFREMPRDYEALCRVYLPRPIHDRAEYENVAEIARVFAGFEEAMSGDQQDYFQLLCSLMEAIPKGNRLVLTYVPGTGTTVEVNGKAKGTLPGKATADAILATWLGPKPGPGEDFKNAVLGK